MHDSYRDIRGRIKDDPRWHDQNGVPRYDVFTPDQCPDIYAKTVVLLEIACQYCGKRFVVQMSYDIFARAAINPKNMHYGDPPSHGCVGDTMNCDDLAVLEVWHRDVFDWERRQELEGAIE